MQPPLRLSKQKANLFFENQNICFYHLVITDDILNDILELLELETNLLKYLATSGRIYIYQPNNVFQRVSYVLTPFTQPTFPLISPGFDLKRCL